jgi:hypothetical protein
MLRESLSACGLTGIKSLATRDRKLELLDTEPKEIT